TFMDHRPPVDVAPTPPAPTSRRDFLQQAAGIAAGIAALTPTAQAADEPKTPAAPLPTIRLGPHEVTRLIIGGNPIYGYSHFNTHFDRHLTAWHTSERVLELLRRCQECGINTWQNSYSART